MARLDQQLDGLATMSPAHLRTEWQRLFREPAPELSDDLLRRSIAYRLQERARGGLAPDIRRKLDRLVGRMEAGRAHTEVLRPSLRPGARLIRDWHGKSHQVLVLDSGFLFEERHYSSLTHIARDITGSNWSGPRFFGLRAARKGRGAKPASAAIRPDKVRCAIYTRKSTEEGLEQEFNSLDAQREACTAYITSQRHEGWTHVPQSYDDGGYSGGSMERPGLRQLLADVAAGKVDVIVVCEVDRLTRSLADFSKIVEVLEKAGASFVSVTQAFNTTTSMGRLMLNVLLSFAQFEREVTGERIRDKVAASKRKGMWMGGPVPLGYPLGGRKLVINEAEAANVRLIYRLYLDLGSIGVLAAELDRRGIRSKQRIYKDGRVVGGVAFRPGPLSYLIRNPTYIGEVEHRGERFTGEHEGIVANDIWEAAQQLLADNRNSHRTARRATSPSLLAGMIRDAGGRGMTPSHSTRGSRRYRYYFTQVGVDRKMPADGWRVPANDVEQAVRDRLQRLLSRSSDLLDALGPIGQPALIVEAATALAASMSAMSNSELRSLLLSIGTGMTIIDAAIGIAVNRCKLLGALGATAFEQDAAWITLQVPATLTRCGHEMRLVIDNSDPVAPAMVDPALLNLIVRAERAYRTLADGGSTIPRLERNELARYARLHTLAPDIVSAIVEGRQPRALSARKLLRTPALPMDWREQRMALGFS